MIQGLWLHLARLWLVRDAVHVHPNMPACSQYPNVTNKVYGIWLELCLAIWDWGDAALVLILLVMIIASTFLHYPMSEQVLNEGDLLRGDR